VRGYCGIRTDKSPHVRQTSLGVRLTHRPYFLISRAPKKLCLECGIRRELKPTNGSWRTDETYVRVAGRWTYLYGAVDSTGATIDFLLSESRDLSSARRFFQKALAAPGHPRPRVINVDGNPSYPTVIEEFKQQRALARRCRCRIVPYLNNIVEQDHRSIKRRVNASLGFRSFDGAQRTIQGYEAMHMIRKGQVRWLSKHDIAAQVRFIKVIFGIAA
jgi:transposase, IS6 family